MSLYGEHDSLLAGDRWLQVGGWLDDRSKITGIRAAVDGQRLEACIITTTLITRINAPGVEPEFREEPGETVIVPAHQIKQLCNKPREAAPEPPPPRDPGKPGR